MVLASLFLLDVLLYAMMVPLANKELLWDKYKFAQVVKVIFILEMRQKSYDRSVMIPSSILIQKIEFVSTCIQTSDDTDNGNNKCYVRVLHKTDGPLLASARSSFIVFAHCLQ